MDISCSECGKHHSIPDTAIDNKKIFFYCNSCGHKIIVDNRKNFIKQQSSRKELPVMADIFSAIPLAFNFNSVLVAGVYAVLFLMTSLLFAVIFGKNIMNPTGNPATVIITGIIISAVFYYFYFVVLYYISKISLFRMLNPGMKRPDWKFINFDFKEDAVVLFIIYILTVIVLALVLLPIIYLTSGGILYTGIMLPLIYFAFFIIVFSVIFMNFIPAVIASKSDFVSGSISGIIDFFKTEFLNIPVYAVLINIISLLTSAIVNFFTIVPLFISGVVITTLLGPDSKMALSVFFTRFISKLSAPASAQVSAVSADITFGTIFIIIFLIAFTVILWALITSITQTLYTKAVFIMQKNPEYSINRNIYVGTLLAIAVIIVILAFMTFKTARTDIFSGLIR